MGERGENEGRRELRRINRSVWAKWWVVGHNVGASE